jgi:hypothetical protein
MEFPHYIAVQTPEYEVSSMGDLGNTPVSTGTVPATTQPAPGELSNVATFTRDSVPGSANEANIQPVYDVYASTQGRDLGSIATDIDQIATKYQKQLAPANTIQVTGQIQSMNQAFRDMSIGLLFAAVFVYLLMVVNYQNFGDPFVVILALPATFCGIVRMLYITDTTLSVPSLMGAIMAVGVASANSILLVTFAREQQLAGSTAFDAAISAGRVPTPSAPPARGPQVHTEPMISASPSLHPLKDWSLRKSRERFTLPISPELRQLREAFQASYPRVRIEDLLQDVDEWCGFTRAFQPLAGYRSRAKDHHRSLLATLIAHGTNPGLAAMSQSADRSPRRRCKTPADGSCARRR